MGRDFTTDASKWDKATSLEFNNTVREAYDGAAEQVDPSVPCVNNNGSVDTDCPCRNCTAARAAHARAVELTNPEEFGNWTNQRKGRYLLHPSKRRNWSKEDYDKHFAETSKQDVVESVEDPTLTARPADWTEEEWSGLTPSRRQRIIENTGRNQAPA